MSMSALSENLFRKAWARIESSGRTVVGEDGVRIQDIQDTRDYILRTYDSILSGHYKPGPIRYVDIPKSNGKMRTISILSLQDHFVHTALKDWLEPQCEGKFFEHSYAYRPKKSAIQAVEKVEQWLNEGWVWIGEADIFQYFDEIDHTLLSYRIESFTENENVATFISQLFSSLDKGIFQGSRFYLIFI